MWRLLSFAVVILAGWFAYARLFSGEEVGVAVQVDPSVAHDVFRSFVTASGEIVAARYADIGTDVMGKIVRLPVHEGQEVRSGQLLAVIDPVQAEAELEAAQKAVEIQEAELETARRNVAVAEADVGPRRVAVEEAQVELRRLRNLLEKGVVSEADFDRARFQLDSALAALKAAEAAAATARQTVAAAERRVQQAQARLKAARDIYRKTEIRSPLDGIVSRLRVREGEMVVVGIQNQPGTTLMTIADLSVMNAEVKVAEADVLRLRLDQPAWVTLDALPEKRFAGRVIEIGTGALQTGGSDTAAREFKVVIRLDEGTPGLRPGMTCDADILVEALRDVVTVPLQAVVLRQVEGADQEGIFTVEAGCARFRPVTAGVIGGLDIVVEGIPAELPVIVGPYQVLQELQDGAPVQIVE
ncbi:MAG: hypothetical protein Kow00109_25500 [Acidobacteriota bacterium]